MNGIKVRRFESVESMIKRFRKITDKPLAEYRRLQYFEKPSEKRNRIKQLRKRQLKIEREQRKNNSGHLAEMD